MNSSSIDSIDTDGIALLKIGNNINCILNWSYNTGYRNDIDIWTDQGSLYTDKIFSKKPEYEPELRLTNLSGNSSKESVKCENHFEKMLEHFFSTLSDKTKIDEERKRIINLATLLEKIKFSSSKKQ